MSVVQKYVGAGLTGPITRQVRDPQRGLSTANAYTGTLTNINALIYGGTIGLTTFAPLPADVRWEKNQLGDGMYELLVSTPDTTTEGGTPDTQDSWELLNNRVEKDLYEHPKTDTLDADPAVNREILHAIKTYQRKLPADQNLPLIGPDEDPVEISGDALKLFNLLFRGTNKFITGEYVLRYSVTCSTRSAVTASFSNCYKLFTTQATVGGSGWGSSLFNPAVSGVTLPASIGFSISEIEELGTAPSGFKWTWLKLGPTVRTAPNGKIVISQEWWLDHWSDWIYDAVA